MAIFNHPVTTSVPWARSGSETMKNSGKTFNSFRSEMSGSPMNSLGDSTTGTGFKTMRTTMH